MVNDARDKQSAYEPNKAKATQVYKDHPAFQDGLSAIAKLVHDASVMAAA